MKDGEHIIISLSVLLPYLPFWNRIIPEELGQKHGGWCHGSLRRRVISSHDSKFIGQTGAIGFHDDGVRLHATPQYREMTYVSIRKGLI